MYKFEIQIRGLIVFPKSRKLKRRGADFGKGTEIASRIFCRADCAAVIYEKIRRGKPIFFGKYGHEFLLNLFPPNFSLTSLAVVRMLLVLAR